MVFSDTSTDGGIVQEARWLVGANTTSYNIKDLTRNINRRYAEAVSMIFQADGRVQWDDTNHASDAIYPTNLVSGTQGYSMLVSHLRITRVEVQDPDGNWARLQPIDQNDVPLSLTDFEDTDGQPRYYDIIGNKINLYPAPSYSATNGLKWWFQRSPDYFTTSDTTQEPGIAEPFHRYLSLGAALDYSIKNNLDIRNRLKEELDEMREAMQAFYNRRNGDENIIMKVRQHNFR